MFGWNSNINREKRRRESEENSLKNEESIDQIYELEVTDNYLQVQMMMELILNTNPQVKQLQFTDYIWVYHNNIPLNNKEYVLHLLSKENVTAAKPLVLNLQY